MNKLYLCFVSIFLIGAIYGEEKESGSIIADLPFKHTTKAQDSFVKDSHIGNGKSLIKTNNPSFGYCELDYLWWKAKRTAYAYRFIPDDASLIRPQGTVYPAKTEFSPGFRVELGFSNLYDWMIGGIFTYYQNHVTDHKNDQSSIYDIGKTVLKLRSEFNLTYWAADLLFSTNFALSRTVNIMPFIAVRGAQFKYHLSLDLIDWVPPQRSFDIHVIRTPYGFFGIGPYIGMKSFYEMNKSGLTLFGTIAGSLLYGKVKARDYNHFVSESLPHILQQTQESYTDWHNHFSDLKANFQLQIGCFWKHYFDCQTKAFKMGLNWEANYFWNVKDYYTTSVGLLAEKSIILMGLNAFIGCEF